MLMTCDGIWYNRTCQTFAVTVLFATNTKEAAGTTRELTTASRKSIAFFKSGFVSQNS